jgi:serine/threonine protein kinase
MISRHRQAIVVDLGLAMRTSIESNGQGLTRSGAVVGTPRYMEPEQMAGELVDARCDQYSFAATALHAMRAGGQEPPPKLRAVIARAMDPVASARFDSMDDLLREMTASISSRPLSVLTFSAIVVTMAAGLGIWTLRTSTDKADIASTTPVADDVHIELPATPIRVTSPPAAIANPSAKESQPPLPLVRSQPRTRQSINSQRKEQPAATNQKTPNIVPPAKSDGSAATAPRDDIKIKATSSRRLQLATADIAEMSMRVQCSSRIADWGRVVKTQATTVTDIGSDIARPTTIYEVIGKKRRYTFDGNSVPFRNQYLSLRADIGDWIMLCSDNEYNGLDIMRVYAPIAGPPSMRLEKKMEINHGNYQPMQSSSFTRFL